MTNRTLNFNHTVQKFQVQSIKRHNLKLLQISNEIQNRMNALTNQSQIIHNMKKTIKTMNLTASESTTQSNDKRKRESENPQQKVINRMLLIIRVKRAQR